MTALPDKLVVGPFVYDVIEQETVLSADKTSVCWGYCQSQKQTITIQSDVPIDRRRTIFWHETLHAIDDAYGNLGLSEEQVIRLGFAIAAIFVHNDCSFLLK